MKQVLACLPLGLPETYRAVARGSFDKFEGVEYSGLKPCWSGACIMYVFIIIIIIIV